MEFFLASFMSYTKIVQILLLNHADPLIKDNEGYNAITWGDIFKLISVLFIFLILIFLLLAYKEIKELFNNHDSKLIKKNKEFLIPLIEGLFDKIKILKINKNNLF
jgi:ankyrin repeat protein